MPMHIRPGEGDPSIAAAFVKGARGRQREPLLVASGPVAARSRIDAGEPARMARPWRLEQTHAPSQSGSEVGLEYGLGIVRIARLAGGEYVHVLAQLARSASGAVSCGPDAPISGNCAFVGRRC